MEFLTFDALQHHLLALFKAGEFEAVRELAAEQTVSFPEQVHILAYWQITAAARQMDYPAAMQQIRRLLERGFWYGESVLTLSPSLQPLQELPEFISLVEASRALRAHAEKDIFPLLVLRQPGRGQKGSAPAPLMLALHTNGGTVQDSLSFWKPAASEGWIAAAPQSTQAVWKGAYVWDDRFTATGDVQRHYQSLVSQYAIDPRRVVLAGHSLGGETAMWLALSEQIPALGFIAFGPAGPLVDDPEQFQDLLFEAAKLRLRGYVIFGEEDENIPQENIRKLVDLLNATGTPTGLESVPHAGHDYDPVYDESMQRALEFIFPGGGRG